MIESLPKYQSQETKEKLLRTEYEGKPSEKIGHIPIVEFNFNESGQPVELRRGLKKYKIETQEEAFSAENFLSHTIERDDNGNIIKVQFENESAKDLFYLVNTYIRDNSLTQIERSLKNDLALNYGSSGSDSQLGFIERRLIKKMMRDITKGTEESSTNDLMVIPNTINEFAIEMQGFFSRYLDKKTRKSPTAVEFPSNDWLSDITEKTVKWIVEVQKSNPEVSVRNTLVHVGRRPIRIKNVRIGSIENHSDPVLDFLNERLAVSGLLMSYEQIRLRYRTNIEIIEYPTSVINDADYDISYVDSSLHPRYYKGKMILHGRSRHIVQNITQDQENREVETINQINTRDVQSDLLHELGHSVDTVSPWSTVPQREGFATAFENGFSFYTCRNHLKNFFEYHNEITRQKLLDILSEKPDMSILNGSEIYGVTSTFFSWVYEQLGPEHFRRFYAHLTGDYFDYGSTGRGRALNDIQTLKLRKKYVGKVINSLDSVHRDHRWTWESSEELIDAYLDDINRGTSTYSDRITTLV